MFDITYQEGNSRKKHLSIKGDSFSIGSARNSDLLIKNKAIAKRHARIYSDSGVLKIRDLGSMAGTWVNRERIVEFGPLGDLDEIAIGAVRLWVIPAEDSSISPPVQQTNTHPVSLPEIAVHKDQRAETLLYWGKIIHDQLIVEMDLRRKDIHSMSDQQLREEAEVLLDGVLKRLQRDLPNGIDTSQLRINVLNEAVGLGPLEHFLDDPTITEIMVNNATEIFIERDGKLQRSELAFSGDHAVLAVIERIITPLGRRIDEASPMVDARLKDGSRVNAIIPPLALKGPSLTIRKFSLHRLQFDDLIGFGALNEDMVEFLRICVERRKNIIVSGGTGSGKTTLLNVLSNFIPASERIVTVEDAAELKLTQTNLVSLESRPANTEGRGAITIRELLKNTLRMRPDRIIVGECRGGEALDMLQAMNTGHDGSLTTAHANTPRDVLSRLEVMVLMAGMDLPVTAIREQVASAIDIIVQQTRFPCGSRKITKITEVVGIESGTVQLQDIFEFRQAATGVDGKVGGVFAATGFVPSFYEHLSQTGVEVDVSIFNNDRISAT